MRKKELENDIRKYIEIPPGVDISRACWTWTGPFCDGQPVYNGLSAGRLVRNRYGTPKLDSASHLTFCVIGDRSCVNPLHRFYYSTDLERIETHVIRPSNTNACTRWRGRSNEKGYPRCWHDDQLKRMSRLLWEQANGPIPDGYCVLHRCDNPECLNLNHLWSGTAKQNREDMVAKGRSRWQRRKQREWLKMMAELFPDEMFMHGTADLY